jgi:transcriptional regulator with XRE-family HTH domain
LYRFTGEETPVTRAANPPVGERIRAERTRLGMSLRALAREVAVSPSLISQIETGKCRPSVNTLYSITTALGISIEEVFENPAGAHTRLIAAGIASTATLPAILGGTVAAPPGPAPGGRPAAPVARAGEREVLELDSGVTWERLGHVPGTHVDFLLVSYAPGGSSSGAGQFMRHSGVEYGYLVEGELTLNLGDEEYRLTAGHSVSFPSSTPHRYRNDAPSPAVGVWFVTG